MVCRRAREHPTYRVETRNNNIETAEDAKKEADFQSFNNDQSSENRRINSAYLNNNYIKGGNNNSRWQNYIIAQLKIKFCFNRHRKYVGFAGVISVLRKTRLYN